MSLVAAVICAAAGVFHVHAVPRPGPEAQCLVAEIVQEATPAVVVVHGQTIRIHGQAGSEEAQTINLEPGTAVFDIRDTDGNGFAEIIALNGRKVQRYDLTTRDTVAAQTLFDLDQPYSGPKESPQASVIVIERQGDILLALPMPEVFELRRLNGELAEAYPTGLNAPHHVVFGQPFAVHTGLASGAGGPGELEMRVVRTLAYKPRLPETALSIGVAAPLGRPATPMQAREAAGLDPSAWPWFALTQEEDAPLRAYYALCPDGSGDTFVRIRSLTQGGGPAKEWGPERRYPGQIMLISETQMDWNGDGFSDAMFWASPRPAPTVSGLSRVIMRGDWPLRLSAHHFLPESNRFAPVPAGRIELNASVGWFMARPGALPLRHVVAEDFDGDGDSDFGCAVSKNAYQVWTHGEAGFGAEPAFRYGFAETITRVVDRVDFEQRGRMSLILEGQERNFYVLHATGETHGQ